MDSVWISSPVNMCLCCCSAGESCPCGLPYHKRIHCKSHSRSHFSIFKTYFNANIYANFTNIKTDKTKKPTSSPTPDPASMFISCYANKDGNIGEEVISVHYPTFLRSEYQCYKSCRFCVDSFDGYCASLGRADGRPYPFYRVTTRKRIPALIASQIRSPTGSSSFSACEGNNCNTPDLQCPIALPPVSRPTLGPSWTILSCYQTLDDGNVTIQNKIPFFTREVYSCVKYCICVFTPSFSCEFIKEQYGFQRTAEIPNFESLPYIQLLSSCVGDNCNNPIPALDCSNAFSPTNVPTSRPTTIPLPSVFSFSTVRLKKMKIYPDQTSQY